MGAKPSVRFLLLTVAAWAWLGSASPEAVAKIPSPPLCSVDPILVGSPECPASNPAFTVIVRDISSGPLPFDPVTLHFTDPSLVLLQEQEPGTVVDCEARTLTRITDDDGTAIFRPRFGGFLNSGEFEVRSKGVLIRRIFVRSTDLDADGETNLADFGHFAEAYAGASGSPETDFDQNGVTDLGDLAMFQSSFFAPKTASRCP